MKNFAALGWLAAANGFACAATLSISRGGVFAAATVGGICLAVTVALLIRGEGK